MSGFDLFPAIDVREGRVVRLRQGDYAQETRYPDEPLAVAKRYAEAGARWLHLVDLDAAREGGYSLIRLLSQIKAVTSLQVQTGGGVRTEEDVERILQAGADRVVVGSLAVREPNRVTAWPERFGADAITVAFDARLLDGRWTLPTAGWTKASDATLDQHVSAYAERGLRHVLCTDIDRDGTLAGPNLDLYRALVKLAPSLKLQASGGVRAIEDIAESRNAGCSAVILGKSLLEGRFDLGEALREERPC